MSDLALEKKLAEEWAEANREGRRASTQETRDHFYRAHSGETLRTLETADIERCAGLFGAEREACLQFAQEAAVERAPAPREHGTINHLNAEPITDIHARMLDMEHRMLIMEEGARKMRRQIDRLLAARTE